MKILHFSRDYTTHDHRFLSKMVETGNEIFFLRLENAGHAYEDRPVPPGVTLIPWAGGTSPVTRGDGPRLLYSLKQVIRHLRPDIIQAGPVQRAAFLTALAGTKNLITMSWGYDLLMDVNNGKSWQWATRYTLQRSVALVGDCDTIRGLAIQHGMNPDKIVTFPWGADIRKFAPLANQRVSESTSQRVSDSASQQISNQQSVIGDGGVPTVLISNLQSPNHPITQSPISSTQLPNYQSPIRLRKGWDSSTFVLLSTRNWTPLYGVEDLARAFVNVARQRPELRLLMLGGGPLSGKIKSMIQSAGMIDRVHFPGHVNQNDLPDHYRAADLYISTSHSDGTSISLLEALASGTPVLLTDIPGNQEWITEQGKVGWTFRDGDPADLERAILHAIDHRDELPTMSRAARQLAEERGDWDKNFPKLLKAWEMVLS